MMLCNQIMAPQETQHLSFSSAGGEFILGFFLVISILTSRRLGHKRQR